GAAAFADIFEIPEPGSLIPWLAGGTEKTKRVHRVEARVAGSHEHADGGGRDAEGCNAAAFDHFPKAVRSRKIRRAVIKKNGSAEVMVSDDGPRTHHPTDVGEPEETV